MAPITSATPQTGPRRRGRPRKYPLPPDSEPPFKKQRYNPSASSGRSTIFARNGLTPNAGASTVPRARPSRRQSDLQATTSRHTPIAPFSRVQDDQHAESAAIPASAVSQSDTFKPREERSWDDFHPELDIDLSLPVYTSEEVDAPSTPIQTGQSGGSPVLGQAIHMLQIQNGAPFLNGNPLPFTPKKRGPGRPPKRPEAILYALTGIVSPTQNQRITPAPLFNVKERLVLPKPNFRRIDTFAAYEKSPGVGINFVEKTFANVGFQESDLFSQPKTLIRGGKSALTDENEATVDQDQGGDDSTLTIPGNNGAHTKVRVEYDMDEQDERWLEVINAERTAGGVDIIRPQYFEIAMTIIEKEWHALERRIPKPNPKPPQTHRARSNSAAAINGEPPAAGEEHDSKCAVCDDGDCENTNAIVFCDGCDLAVHQECYGVPFIPEGQWLCRRCQLIGRNTSTAYPHMCIFCPNVEGAYKQTTNMKWAHLLCALWIPEVSIGNQTLMEPVQDVEKVPKQRWKLTCYICQQKMGACIQCSNKNCYLAFHVTCARKCRLQLKMKGPHGGILEKNTLKGYCDKHVPADWRVEHNVEAATEEAKEFFRRNYKGHRWADSQQSALAIEQAQENPENEQDPNEDPFSALGNNKRKKALLKKIWRLPSGAPIVPQLVFNNVETILARWALRKRKEFVGEACKYWTLKREARRGAALLKRLQLQLETFSSMEMTRRNFAQMGAAGGPKLQSRIEFAEQLEKDLDQVRELCKTAQEREALKVKDINLLREIIDTVYFPIPPLLWPVLEKAQSLDSNYNYFKKGLLEIHRKLDQRFYVSVAVFATDLGQALNEVVFNQHPGEIEEFPPKPISEPLNVKEQAKHKATQKDKLARAKRIIKSVTPDLLLAAAKEADLGVKSQDEEQHTISSILENCLHSIAGPAMFPSDGEVQDNGSVAESELAQDLQLVATDLAAKSTRTEQLRAENGPQDIDMLDAGDSTAAYGVNLPLINGTTNGDTDAGAMHPTSTHEGDYSHHSHVISARNTPGLNIPALSNSGSTNHSTTTHEPLTPPAEKDLTTLGSGGVPWYLEQFEPKGTTIHDPGEVVVLPDHESTRDTIREASEELSELDDEAVNGLVDHMKESMSVLKADTLVVPSVTPKRKARPKRRRY